MMNPFSRTEMIFGKDGMEKLSKARVAIFGLGGVGGYVMEALARGGVGALDLIDGDRICLTNLNRQILATRKTIGRYKVDVGKERVLDINPDIKVNTFNVFYSAETSGLINFALYDYVVDAIDTVSSKVELVVQAKRANVPVISSMGAGNKVDPTDFKVADIFSTSVCPLARAMRKELRNRGIESLKVVYSKELPVITKQEHADNRHVPGSNSFVPPVAGLIIASEVIKDLTGYRHG